MTFAVLPALLGALLGASAPAAKDFPASDTTVSLLRTIDGAKCEWVKADPARSLERVIATVDGACRDLALNAAVTQALVVTGDEKPRLYQVEIATGAVHPLPNLPGLTEHGFGGNDRPLVIESRPLTEDELRLGSVETLGRKVALCRFATDLYVLLSYVYENGRWSAVEVEPDSQLTEFAGPQTSRLWAWAELRRHTAQEGPFPEREPVTDAQLVRALDDAAATGGGGHWSRVPLPNGFAFMSWVPYGDVPHPTTPWLLHDGKPEPLTDSPFKPRDPLAIRARGASLLLYTWQGEGPDGSYGLYRDGKSLQRGRAKRVGFWPRPGEVMDKAAGSARGETPPLNTQRALTSSMAGEYRDAASGERLTVAGCGAQQRFLYRGPHEPKPVALDTRFPEHRAFLEITFPGEKEPRSLTPDDDRRALTCLSPERKKQKFVRVK